MGWHLQLLPVVGVWYLNLINFDILFATTKSTFIILSMTYSDSMDIFIGLCYEKLVNVNFTPKVVF